MMAFVSELTGKPVTDIQGRKVGVVSDIIARQRHEFQHPVVEAIEVDRKGKKIMIPYSDIAALLSAAVPLNTSYDKLNHFELREDDFSLVDDVLDKQIIDIDGARVVRVNDIELLRVNGNVVVSNVDVGMPGILRRMGWGRTASLASRMKVIFPETTISWEFVELLRRDPFMRLRVPIKKLADLHPADLAEILTDLSQTEGGELLENLDVKQAADTLEEVETDLQVSLLESMSDERVADVLEEMSPDEAADLLAELPHDRSEDLLDLMEDDDAEDVRKLLAYNEDTAGGLMTTEYAAVSPNITAAEAIEELRAMKDEVEQLFYVYVLGEQNHLEGVFSLSDLVLADPNTPVQEFMHNRVVTVLPDENQDELAHQVAKYNLLALPVVDENGNLLGIVTADDALDKIIPTAWKKRLPHFFR
jgi:CBS domain-containing protein